jgi:hypothetical protein
MLMSTDPAALWYDGIAQSATPSALPTDKFGAEAKKGLAHMAQCAYKIRMNDHQPPVLSLQAIRSRKNELLSTAAKYDSLAAKARTEAADYEAAERVWLKMFPSPDRSATVERTPPEAGATTGADTEGLGKKPGSPPITQMIIEALTDAANNGAPGLTPSGILSFVQAKYWPGAKNADVGSTAWRMWKHGRLTRPREGFYGLPNGKGPHPDPLAADQDTKSEVV